VHVSDNDGGDWTTYKSFIGIPDKTYVQDLKPSLHDENVVYAVFNNHKNGDFKPYILKSSNKGGAWTNITGNLPERGSVYSIAEDHVNPNLLFAGTEFGVFFTLDGGKNWKQLKGGLPTIAVRDIEIQRRENDLVLATFGRGFYILDDYSPLRNITEEMLDKEAVIFPIKDGLLFQEAYIGGIDYKGSQYYTASNPEIGTTITYFIKEAPKSLKAKRQEAEKDADPIKYPTAEEIRAEDFEESNYLIFAISDANGNEIRRINRAYSSGVQRFTWDGRVGSNMDLKVNGGPMTNADGAYFAPEGDYSISIFKSVNGKVDMLAEPQPFRVKHLNNNQLVATDGVALAKFQKEVDLVGRNLSAVDEYYKETNMLVDHLKAAARNTPGAPVANLSALRDLEIRLAKVDIALHGDGSLKSREQPVMPSLQERLGLTAWASWYNTVEPTGTQKQDLQIVKDALPALTTELASIMEAAISIKEELYRSGAPYLRGDLPK
jgi:hypothetical protein